jgi:hypothetical protein
LAKFRAQIDKATDIVAGNPSGTKEAAIATANTSALNI